MRQQFETQLQELLERILLMGGTAEAMVGTAVDGLLTRDQGHSADVFENEKRVNALEIEVDDRVVGLIVQHQPVARDARMATASLRAATELERIGDQAINIVKNTSYVLKESRALVPSELRAMAELARKMLADSLAALATLNCESAEQVVRDEQRANALRDETFRVLLRQMIVDPLTAQQSMSLVLISRNLERISDHATSIAQEVVYLVRGQDVRHRHDWIMQDDVAENASQNNNQA